jgi:methionyl-tRNA formyltransferase
MPGVGLSRGVVVERVRTDDGREFDAADQFPQMGGYLTAHPTRPS